MRGAANTVRPELVEGLSFALYGEGIGKGFDKLSPNGFLYAPADPIS
jgi:hypothetical protein